MGTIVRSLAIANPPRYVTGGEAFQFMAAHFEMAQEERELYRRLLLKGPIRGRYLGLEYDEQICQMTADQQLERFQKQALAMSTRAARQALADAGLRPDQIDGVVVNTCTGYLCPGLSSYLAEALELPQSVRALDLMGMGCGAAIPNLQTAAGLLATGAHSAAGAVLCVAVEVCSATIFMGADPGLIVSNCIFGDGAAAAVLCHNGNAAAAPAGNGDAAGVKLLDFESALLPGHRELLRYHHHEGRLKNSLSIRVPVIAGQVVRQVARRLLERHGLSRDDIHWWLVHPGGTAVLEQVARELELTHESLRYSYEVLSEFGNMSSPSVLFVLKRVLERGRPGAGQRGILLSFGAGFTAFAALVEF